MRKLLSVPILLAAMVAAMFAGYHPASADPTFGLDPASPSLGAIGPVFGPGPGQILVPSTFPFPGGGGPIVGPSAPPFATVPSAALGLAPGDDTDDISYGDDCFIFGGCPAAAPFYFPFSVDRTSVGGGAFTAVSTEVFGADSAAAADVFTTPGLGGPPCGATPNFLVIDGDGLLGGGPPPPGTVGMGLMEPLAPPPNFAQDDLDSLEMSDPIAVDFAPPWDGVLEAPVFFTLDPVSAGFYGLSPADVLVAGPPYAPPGVFIVWAPAVVLGLDSFGPATDDIDALGVSIPPGAPCAIRRGGYGRDLLARHVFRLARRPADGLWSRPGDRRRHMVCCGARGPHGVTPNARRRGVRSRHCPQRRAESIHCERQRQPGRNRLRLRSRGGYRR